MRETRRSWIGCGPGLRLCAEQAQGSRMEREHSHEIPDLLLERLRTSGPFVTFRRRAVLAFANNAWCMVCCTVEAFGRGESVPAPVASRRYPLAVLYEDF